MHCVVRFACFTLLAFPAAAGIGCSSGSTAEVTGFVASPLATSTSASGSLSLSVRTSPQPPVAGMTVAQVVITNVETGKPATGLTFTVVPWMPAMGHGTSLVPTVTELGDGKYEIDQLSLFMPGEWELRLTFSGATADTANPVFNVL